MLNNLSFHTQDATQVLVGRITFNERDIYVAVTHWHASPRDDSCFRELLLSLMDRWGYTLEEYRAAVTQLVVLVI